MRGYWTDLPKKGYWRDSAKRRSSPRGIEIWVSDLSVRNNGYWRRIPNRAIARNANRVKPSQVSLKPGKGSPGRGGGEGGQYWHVYAGGKRAGHVYINQIDEEPIGKHASISIELNQQSRGRGIGSIAYQKASRASQHDTIYAHMRKSNIASRKAAERAGYEEYKEAKTRQTIMVWHRHKNDSRKKPR